MCITHGNELRVCTLWGSRLADRAISETDTEEKRKKRESTLHQERKKTENTLQKLLYLKLDSVSGTEKIKVLQPLWARFASDKVSKCPSQIYKKSTGFQRVYLKARAYKLLDAEKTNRQSIQSEIETRSLTKGERKHIRWPLRIVRVFFFTTKDILSKCFLFSCPDALSWMWVGGGGEGEKPL